MSLYIHVLSATKGCSSFPEHSFSTAICHFIMSESASSLEICDPVLYLKVLHNISQAPGIFASGPHGLDRCIPINGKSLEVMCVSYRSKWLGSKCRGWRAGSVVKSTGPELGSQLLYQVAHNYMELHLQRIWHSLLASRGIHMYIWILTHVQK